jgi:hypothetical protein
VCKALEEVATQVHAKSITSGRSILLQLNIPRLYALLLSCLCIIPLVAIAYVMHKAPYSFPVVGGRKVEHLLANIEALSIHLSEEQIKFIDGILPFDMGFPQGLMVRLQILCFLGFLSSSSLLHIFLSFPFGSSKKIDTDALR